MNKNSDTPTPTLLTAVAVARRLGVTVQTLHSMRRSGRFPVPELCINGRPRFDSADVESWIESLKKRDAVA